MTTATLTKHWLVYFAGFSFLVVYLKYLGLSTIDNRTLGCSHKPMTRSALCVHM